MIETLTFIAGVFLINIVIRFLNKDKVTYIFSSLAPLTFGVLMLIYPFWSFKVYDFFYPPDPSEEFKCGNAYLGAMMFQWVIGIPVVYLVQRVLNKYLHKINLLVEKF